MIRGMGLRVEGLVRFYNHVRDSLARGIPAGEAEAFRRRVRDALAAVRAVCGAAGATPEDLPAPSRRAWRFLAGLDLAHLPAPRAAAPAPLPPIALRGMAGLEAHYGRLLWARRERLLADEGERLALAGEIALRTQRIEGLCAERGARPSALSERSRRHYAWLSLLADEACLERHAAALVLAARILPGIEIRLVGAHRLWKRQRTDAGVLISVSEGLLHAPEEVWRELLPWAAAQTGRPPADSALYRFVTSPAFTEVTMRLDGPWDAARIPPARCHDLEASFDRVNSRFFAGGVPRPALAFGRSPSSHRLAWCERARRRIVFSALLDDPALPEEAIDLLMYHEVLHLVLGVGAKNGRREIHGPRFREAERRFPGFAEVRRAIAEFLAARV